MAFLDNSGDIILDAVLTDTGRKRLAKGDGTFKIVKFALADDEIDYSLYQNANHVSGSHASGSAYYDLDILMSPILEAFTNNSASMKSKLISIPRNNLLYLPVLRLNTTSTLGSPNNNTTLASGSYAVAVDQDTENAYATLQGVMTGFTSEKDTGSGADTITYIKVEQGLDTTALPIHETIDSDLKETQYIIEIDNRLGTIQNWYSGSQGSGGQQNTGLTGTDLVPSYIDDDHIASYYVSLGVDAGVVQSMDPPAIGTAPTWFQIQGPLGTKVVFTIGASLELRTSTHLFTKLGGTGTATTADTGLTSAYSFKYIDTNIRITGATTGASIDIPVRFVKND